MSGQSPVLVTIETQINAPMAKVWDYFTLPEHITQWNFATEEWHTPWARSDFRVGGEFTSRMEARDGSMGFDFSGRFDDIQPHRLVAYTIGDGRKVAVHFSEAGPQVLIREEFEAEIVNPVDLQRMGWQAILDNFKKYTESN